MEAILPAASRVVAARAARRAPGSTPNAARPATVAAMAGDGDGSTSGLDHPEVRAWLARLETEAAVLPEDRRTELRASVEDYLADAARDAGPDEPRGRRARPRRARVARRAGRRGRRVRRVPRRRAARPGRRGRRRQGTPWLEVATVTLLAASVVLALVPGDRGVRAGAVVRRHPARAALAAVERRATRPWPCWRSACSGVPLLLLGRDELPTAASLVVSVLLVALWVAAAGRLLARARVAARAGPRPADALSAALRRRVPSAVADGPAPQHLELRPGHDEGGPRGGEPPSWGGSAGGWGQRRCLRSPCRPCRRHRAWPERPSPACRR